jgi:hypothetical protein
MCSKPPWDSDVKVEINIPKSTETLRRYESTFHRHAEKATVQHILVLEAPMFGLKAWDVLKLKCDVAEKKDVEHRFNADKRMAEWDWLTDFRKRIPRISLRRPEPTSETCTQTFNRPQVQKHFSLLVETFRKANISSTRIFNMTKSALATVQKPTKISAF